MHSSASAGKRSSRLIAGRRWIVLIFLVLTSFSTLAAFAESDKQHSAAFSYFPERPEDVSPERWTGLRTAVEQAKLLPRSEGIGREDGQFGYSVSLSGNRALIGGIGLGESVAGGAVVFFNVGSTWVKEASLVPAEAIQGSAFGHSVSLDGDRALVGSPQDQSDGLEFGSVYVFEFNGSSWAETEKLLPADAAEFDRFGWSVSLKGDHALIGSPEDDDNGLGSGSVYVFEFLDRDWTETAKLLPSDGDQFDGFGSTVSLWHDRALVGVPSDDENGTLSGSAYIFDFNGIMWVETIKLLPANGAERDRFGSSVSIYGDRVLVGAYRDGDKQDDLVNDSGSAYVFEFDGSTWSETAILTASDGDELDWFGWSVSLSGDRALIGSRFDDNNGSFELGSAYVYDFNGMVWSETAKLTASDGAFRDQFGSAVSLSGDQILIGVPFDDDVLEDIGSALVFEFNGATWAETAELVAGDGAFGDQFGFSVSLFGNRALVGTPNDDDKGRSSGSAYVFDYNGTMWTETAKLLPSDGGPFRDFGESVSLFGDRALIGQNGSAYVFDFDGTMWTETTRLQPAIGSSGFGGSVSLFGSRALIGANADNENGRNSGAAFVFDFNGAGWTETAKLKPTDNASGDNFGSAVSLFSDRALIGAPFDDDSGSSSGSAYVFDFIGAEWRETSKLLPADGAESDNFGRSVSVFGDRALVGAPGDDDNGSSSGSAYVFEFKDFDWIEMAKLLPADGAESDDFGESVSLFGNRALVGTPSDDDNGDRSGSAYVFDLIGANWRETVKLLPADGAEFDRFGVSGSLFANRVLVGTLGDDDSGAGSGSAYVFDLLQVFQDDFESEL